MPVLKPGLRLFSAVCSTEMIVVRAPDTDLVVTLGGAKALTSAVEQRGEVVAGHDGGTLIGKRYVDDSESLEILCTKSGAGVPALNGVLLRLKDSKALPSSD